MHVQASRALHLDLGDTHHQEKEPAAQLELHTLIVRPHKYRSIVPSPYEVVSVFQAPLTNGQCRRRVFEHIGTKPFARSWYLRIYAFSSSDWTICGRQCNIYISFLNG